MQRAKLSGGTISANSQGEVLAVPAIRASIGVDPGEYHRGPVSLLSKVNQSYGEIRENGPFMIILHPTNNLITRI